MRPQFLEPAILHSQGPGPDDVYGNDTTVDVDTATSGAFAPAGSAELVQGRDTVSTQDAFYIFGAPAVAPAAIDQITVRGTRYDVDGTPAVWISPFTGWAPGLVVKLKAVTG